MGPLKNIKHEKFARALVESNSPYKAYKEICPESTENTARVNPYRMLENASIRERVTSILEEQKIGFPELSARLKQFIYSENEGIGLKAVEDGFKLLGAFDENKEGPTLNAIQIVFSNPSAPKPSDPAPNDPKI